MVNVIIVFGCFIVVMICGVFVMQCLNRQELLTQREDIEMMRFRLKTINSEQEEVLNILKTAQMPAEEKQKPVPVETTEEDVKKFVESAQNTDVIINESNQQLDNYGFKTAPAEIGSKKDERIEYEEENFIIEEDE